MQAQRRGWRYFATRLHGDGTETLIDPDLPIEDVTIEDVLSGDGSISGTISPVYPKLIADDGEPILQEWSTAIYAENDGDIRAGGILTNSNLQGPSWQLECPGWTNYGRDLPWTGKGWYGVEVDPIDIARFIWEHIQSHQGGNIGLQLANTDTGGEVTLGTELEQVEFDTQEGPVSFEAGPYKLNWYTDHDLQGDFDDLAADTPFDWRVRHYWDGEQIVHKMDIGYPKLGRRRKDLRFVFGVNIFDAPATERDGALYASGTLVLGAGEGASMVHSLREPPRGKNARLRRIAVVEDASIKSKRRANRRADAENQWRGRLDNIDTLVVQDHPHAPLGAARVGDEIRVEGRGGWRDTDMWVRVLGIAYQPANGQIAEYTVARTDMLVD